ncbi:lipoate--protein ligase family protein [Halodesulfurarchaeum sp.]|uniref:lipoate--protein ligase family protein n=1 Tax=Halodesulfurarchaeum sp. TaxID=1980530 RepID=UPI001BBF1F33|nr:lipoate--protein ligase family protein [Halodesulfurarchaeum sp.]
MEWRLIRSGQFDAATNMAIDEAIQERIAAGADSVIRLYRWDPAAVSIGYFQRLREEVDIETCKAEGIDYVRRRTGGGAVFHDPEGELTYSVIAPESVYPADVEASYRAIIGRVIDGFEQVGIDADFAPINDVEVDGRKISGNAQTRRDGVLLQHGTLLYDLNPEQMFSALSVDAAKISEKHLENARDRVAPVRSLVDASRADLKAAMIDAFTSDRSVRASDYLDAERERAAELATKKYRTDAWNFDRDQGSLTDPN